MLLYFPVMHAELVQQGLPKGVHVLDPGLSASAGEMIFRPESLTLSTAEAKYAVNDFIAFGESTPHARDLSFFAAGTMEDFYTGSSLAIAAELGALESGDRPMRTEDFTDDFRKAQLTLLMAWTLEERLMEFQRHSLRFEGALATFGKSLGLSGEDAEELRAFGLGQDLPELEAAGCEIQRNWRKILPPMAMLVPADTVFVTYDTCDIVLADLEEMSLTPRMLETADDIAGLPAGTLVVRVPLWRLAGRTRAPGAGSPFAAECVLAILPESSASLPRD